MARYWLGVPVTKVQAKAAPSAGPKAMCAQSGAFCAHCRVWGGSARGHHHEKRPGLSRALGGTNKAQVALHEAGRYLTGKPLLLAGPQRQPEMVLPPSVLPLTGVSPVCKGVNAMVLAEALVLPRSASC